MIRQKKKKKERTIKGYGSAAMLKNKEKSSNAFFDTNVNKSVYLFVYGFRLTFAGYLWMETYLTASLLHNLLESRRSYFTKPYFCDVPRNIRLPLWSDHDIAGPHRINTLSLEYTPYGKKKKK